MPLTGQSTNGQSVERSASHLLFYLSFLPSAFTFYLFSFSSSSSSVLVRSEVFVVVVVVLGVVCFLFPISFVFFFVLCFFFCPVFVYFALAIHATSLQVTRSQLQGLP